MLRDDVWNLTGLTVGWLCVGCVEARLGRELTPEDFTPGLPVNEPCPWDTLRLASRKSGLPERALEGRWPTAGRAAHAA